MSDIVFTVKLKLGWQDQMAFDQDLSHLSFRIGFAIGSHINKKTGAARIARTTLKKKLGVCVRSIEKAIKELERLGHIEVEKTPIGIDSLGRSIHGGRVNANVYRPVVKTANGGSPFVDPKRANTGIEKGEKNGSKGRTTVRSYPCSTQIHTQGTRVSASECSTVSTEQIASAALASRTVFVAKADDRWSALDARWRREKNPRGTPVETFLKHGNQHGWTFPVEWLEDLERNDTDLNVTMISEGAVPQ